MKGNVRTAVFAIAAVLGAGLGKKGVMYNAGDSVPDWYDTRKKRKGLNQRQRRKRARQNPHSTKFLGRK